MTSTTPAPSATLASPLRLPNGQVLGNRIMKSALSEGLAGADHLPGERIGALYRRWSDGGFGLVVTGNVMVDRRHLGEPGNVVLEADSDLDGFRSWAKTVQDGGSPVWMQLNHPGRQASPLASTHHAVAPSSRGVAIPGVPAPRALTDAEIGDIVERFATAAARADAAGFDGVQIHAAHGYLVSQFLSPLSNDRTDRWGGDIDGRMRFLLALVHAIRDAVRPGFALGVKLNSADFQRGGFTEDDSRAVIDAIADEDIDLLEISGGSYESPAMMGRAQSDSTRAREAYFLDYAETVRAVAKDIPIAVTGGFRSRDTMARAIADGLCDVVGIGRPAAVLPDAAGAVLRGGTTVLPAGSLRLPVPARVGAARTARTVEGALDLQWHTDQLHRMGDGDDPDPDRPLRRTVVSTLRRNGFDALRSRRRGVTASSDTAARKFRVERAVGRRVANPTVRALGRLGIRTSLATEIETTGRKTGLRRRVPVTAAFDTTGAWVISQHGRRSGWGANIAADPAVSIRQGDRWRSGTAAFVPDDDVRARAATFASHPALRPLAVAVARATATTPISVRISFTDIPGARP
ncbi:MAG: nitroreductase family deazaflavin-dependent oxidoreductase [Gordonia paraffinivorans]